MFSCARITTFRAFARPSVASRSLATVSAGNVDTSGIPIVDFANFGSLSFAQRRETARQVVDGFKSTGFVYLGNHGISEKVVQEAFKRSDEFFQLPFEKKQALAWEDPRSNRGYVQLGRERVTNSQDETEIARLRASAPDYKESMEIGRDWSSTWKNMWPHESDVPGFRAFMLEFFQTCHELHVRVMRAVALGLDLQENFFQDKINAQDHNLRLLHYPAIKTDLLHNDGQARAGAHTDYGTVTLLFQDPVGGLQVQNPTTKEFAPAPPIPGTVIINAADLLARWSNDLFRSTLHRVVAPPFKPINEGEGIIPKRQSIAFFCNPNFNAEISCLPHCFGPGNPKKYDPVTTEEYIVRRLRETYL
ncbi:Clavaminate synthase-like protein [Thelephora terrestris]|uniref:Clavaminate synthase-like protein n=1 Tax=Thelephora terrestris TaxID=56493 RepID=A0A9P6HP56_9AGAM|nr:Clavaminate synthase-like protein [Thelephora terrestris]